MDAEKLNQQKETETMHRKAKWLAALLAVLLVLSMAACGGRNTEGALPEELQGGGAAEPQEAPETPEETEPAEEPEEPAAETPEAEKTEEPSGEALNTEKTEEPSEETPGTEPTEEPSEEAAEPDTGDFVRGTLNGNTYESQPLAVGFTLGEGWEAASAEELAILSGVDTTGLSEAEMIEQTAEADAIFDFYAMSGDGLALVQVIYEDLGVLYGTLLDENGYLNMVVESLEGEMTAAGMTDVESEEITVTFAGRERQALFIRSEMPVEGSDQSIAIYQKLVPIKTGSYMAVAWVSTYLEDATDAALENFYALP